MRVTDVPGERVQNAGIFDENDNLIAELVRDGELVGDPNETFRIGDARLPRRLAAIRTSCRTCLNPNRVDRQPNSMSTSEIDGHH